MSISAAPDVFINYLIFNAIYKSFSSSATFIAEALICLRKLPWHYLIDIITDIKNNQIFFIVALIVQLL
jgi:hypothetical protein